MARDKRRVVGKSANYTIVVPNDRSQTLFTNEGATGAITFTLPAANAAIFGIEYVFVAVVDQNIIVAPPVADTLITTNDLAADSVALQTSSQKIGGRIVATVVRTGGSTYQWAVAVMSVGHTNTVAT